MDLSEQYERLIRERRMSAILEEIRRARHDARSARERARELERDVERLHLFSRALWDLLKVECQLVDDDLFAEMRRLAARTRRGAGGASEAPSGSTAPAA